MRYFYLLLIVICFPSQAGSNDLGRLSSWLEGGFSSQLQAKEDPAFQDLRIHIRRFWHERVDGHWLYVERSKADEPGKPYRQRLYQLIGQPGGSIKLHIYAVPKPIDFAGAYFKPDLLDSLTIQQLGLQVGCDISLQHNSTSLFEGRTASKQCKANFQGAQYLITDMAIKTAGFVLWERGYNKLDRQVWGSSHKGYIFQKRTAK